jgi:hypothetical protein
MRRRVEPEWLDELAADDPRAQRSRRDLRRLNAIMRHAGLLAGRLLDGHTHTPPYRLVEIGCGDGTFFLALARKLLPVWNRLDVVLVDQVNIVDSATRAQLEALGCRCQCVQAEVFEWLASDGAMPGDWVVANLFLHHFPEDRLRLLLGRVAERASCLAACEPRRSWPVLMFSRMLGLIGCNDVSRHDAVLSVRAGFRDGELGTLWRGQFAGRPSDQSCWITEECGAGWFSHRFVARRFAPDHHRHA